MRESSASDRQLFPRPLAEYWTESGRNIFRKKDDRVALPPAEIELPPIEFPEKIAMAPMPAPHPKYWGKFPLAAFTPLETATPLEIKGPSRISLPLSPLAADIKSQVRATDSVELKNKKKWNGTILEENQNEVVIHVEEPSSRTYTWPRDVIKEIHHALTIEEVCRKKFEASASPESLLELAKACAELELDEPATEYFEALLSRAPKLPAAYLACGRYHTTRLDYEAACRVYLRALQNLDDEQIRLAMAGLQADLGLPHRALRTLGLANEVPSLLFGIELAYLLQNRDAAEQLTERLGKKCEVGSEYWNIYCYWRARWALEDGSVEDTLAWCRKVVPPVPPVVDNVEGVALYLSGDLKEAGKAFRRAGEGNVAEAWYNLALTYFAGNAGSEAIAILDAIRYKAPFAGDPSRILAVMAYFTYRVNPRENHSRAIELMRSAQKSNPENFWVYYLFGEIEENTPAAAYQYYREALDREFSFSYLLVQTAAMALQLGKNEDARYLLEELSLRSAPLRLKTRSYLYALLARMCIGQGNEAPACAVSGSNWAAQRQMDRAREELQQALAIDPGNQFALCMMGFLYNRAQDNGKADSYLESVLAQIPGHPYALGARQKIRQSEGRMLWEDRFSRADGDSIKLGWLEKEPQGIEIFLSREQVLIHGKQGANLPATLTRSIPAATFASLAAVLDVTSAGGADVGIFVAGYPDGPIAGIGKDHHNVLKYSPKGSKQGVPLTDWEAVPGNLTLAAGKHCWEIRREANVYRFLLDGTLLSPEISLNLSNYESLRAGIFAFPRPDTVWEFSVNCVRIIESR